WEYAITLVKTGGIRMNADRAVALLFQPGSQGRHRPSRAYCAIGVEAVHTQSTVFNTAQEGKLRAHCVRPPSGDLQISAGNRFGFEAVKLRQNLWPNSIRNSPGIKERLALYGNQMGQISHGTRARQNRRRRWGNTSKRGRQAWTLSALLPVSPKAG